jgi:hypothetical protein
MLSLYIFFNLIVFSNSSFISCRHHKSMETCLSHDLCKWCNSSVPLGNNSYEYNNTGVCRYATSYVLDTNDMCYYNNNYEYIVTLVNMIINITLIVIFMVLLSYIVGISEKILNNYFASSDNNNSDRLKEKSLLIFIISSTVFAPAIIFLFLAFKYFMVYFLFLLVLTVVINCSLNTQKVYSYTKNQEKKGYDNI